MSNLSIPCGFGPPGELPQPLPGGVEGGVIVIPGEGGGNIPPLGEIPDEPKPPKPPVQPPIIIGGAGVTVTTNTITLDYLFNSNVNATTLLNNPATGQTWQLDYSNTYQNGWTLFFSNLTPGTLYNFTSTFIKLANSKSQLIVTGTATTLPQAVTLGEIGEELKPTENIPNSLPEFPSEEQDIYSNFINATAYADGDLDLKFTPYKITPTDFSPVRGSKDTNIFKPIRHKSLDNMLKGEVTTFEIVNLDKENTTHKHIKLSLNKELANIVYNLKSKNGIAVPETLISDSFLSHVYNTTTNIIDTGYLFSLKELAVSSPPVKPTKQAIVKNSYGVKPEVIKSSRVIQPETAIVSDVQYKKSTGLKLLREKLLSIDPNFYVDDSSELLKLWYCLPEDINKRIQILNSDGTVSCVYIPNTDQTSLILSDGTSALVSISNNDSIKLLGANADEENLFVTTDIDRARNLRNLDEQLIMKHLGVDKDYVLQASCSNTNIEFTLSSPPDPNNHYVLVLNTSEITSKFSEESEFITETTAKYTLMTTSISDVSNVNTNLKYRAFPWLTLCIDYNDPILDYFNDNTNSFTLTFKDLTYKSISDVEEIFDPLIPRKIPRCILISPTDKTKYNLFNQFSVLSDWSIRRLRFVLSPDPTLAEQGITNSPFIIENTFINSNGESKYDEFSTQAYHCRYETTQANFNSAARDINNMPTRKGDSFRKFIRIITSLNNNFSLDKGVTWYDIYSRLTRREFYMLSRTVTKTLLGKVEVGEKTGVKLFNVKGGLNKTILSRRKNTRLVSLNPDGVDEFPVKYAAVDITNLNNTANSVQEVTSPILEIGES